eukprot:282973_1
MVQNKSEMTYFEKNWRKIKEGTQPERLSSHRTTLTTSHPRENKDLANDVADQIFTKYDTLVILKAILALKDTYFDLNHQKDYKTEPSSGVFVCGCLFNIVL